MDTTKQSEIRGGLNKLGHYFMGKYFGRDISVKQFNKKIDETLANLHSQGVVIFRYPEKGEDLTGACLVFLEPLIKEG